VINRLLKFRSQKGAALVEFALVALMLFTIVFGMVEFSRVWMLLGIMNGAVRVGARYAAILPDVEDNLDKVTTKVTDVLSASSIPAGDIEKIEIDLSQSPTMGTPITVRVEVTFHSFFGDLFPRLNNLSLKAACCMRREI
jgi:Flp pilus assembly protein TadG